MRVAAVLACVLAGCLAQEPQKCSSPPLMTGALTVSTQSEKFWTYAPYLYDAMGQRLRLFEMGIYENKTFTYDVLMLYKQAVYYEIDDAKRKCTKKPLKGDFTPIAVPSDASLVGQSVVGSSSGPGSGLLVNTWSGLAPGVGQYYFTVTEFGCFPVSVVTHTADYGWVLTSYFNNLVGITDPSKLNPPDFCKGVELSQEEPVDFFGMFLKKKQ